jgi:hypothetical protein
MQERGIPVTMGYISDAHDRRSGGAFGPGEAGYVTQLQSYDAAFGAFFERLARDGIDSHNTLFVFTADEGDHFAGGSPSPSSCDGVRTPCSYRQLGEIVVNLNGLLSAQGIRTPFAVHADSAPAVYLNGDPAPTAAVTRAFEKAAWNLRVANPYSGATEQPAAFLADRAEMKLLHMITADAARTPTFIDFLKPDYFGTAGAGSCEQPCVRLDTGSAWNHGSIAPEMNTVWLGLAGPGVATTGVDAGTWSDETDIRPTMLFLAGLRDLYRDDGRVLLEALDPGTLGGSRASYLQLARVYKQIQSPLGQLAMRSLIAATGAIAGSDAAYQQFLDRLAMLEARRDPLAVQISARLEAAAFAGQPLDAPAAGALVEQANALLGTNLL